jgi:tetratricopeptide (TPR) repeat protein
MLKRLLSALKRSKTAAPLQDDTRFVSAYDLNGREIKVARAEWREKVLFPNLKANWDNPDGLYNLIRSSLDDDFGPDLLHAAHRLVEIDPVPERGHTIHGIVLMKNGQLKAADATLRAGMAKVGETATLLTNLAKVVDERGDSALAEQMLWRAVQAEPNLTNTLGWWLAIQHERDGESGYVQALHTSAALPTSWLSQIWLARHHLEAGQLAKARALYGEVLAGGQYDGDALMMVSGDLGTHGHIAEIVELVAPVFEPTRHGPAAGLNLLRAYLQLRRIAEGEAMLARLYSLNLPPYRQQLDEFEHTFQRMKQDPGAAPPKGPVTAVVR